MRQETSYLYSDPEKRQMKTTCLLLPQTHLIEQCSIPLLLSTPNPLLRVNFKSPTQCTMYPFWMGGIAALGSIAADIQEIQLLPSF